MGAGRSGQMVLVMGTSNCYMMNSDQEKAVPGIAGIVRGGILPGLVGYEVSKPNPNVERYRVPKPIP